MKITHFQRKSTMVVNMSERYSLVLRGTFFGRTLTWPDLLIKRRLLKASCPCGILLTVSPRSDVESTNTTPLPSFTSVEDSLSSSKRLSRHEALRTSSLIGQLCYFRCSGCSKFIGSFLIGLVKAEVWFVFGS